MSYISPRAEVAEQVYIGNNVVVLGQVRIARGTVIEDNCVIGKPSQSQLARFRDSFDGADRRPDYAAYEASVDTPTVIGEGVLLLAGATIFSGAQLAGGVVCEDGTMVRWDSTVDEATEIKNGGVIGSRVHIGRHARVGGFCCNGSRLGNYVSVFGNLLHAYTAYALRWSGRIDPAPVLENRVTVGYGAQIVGGITIHENSYVAAGAVATSDVPTGVVVTGCNVHTALSDWKGSLKDTYLGSFPADEPD